MHIQSGVHVQWWGVAGKPSTYTNEPTNALMADLGRDTVRTQLRALEKARWPNAERFSQPNGMCMGCLGTDHPSPMRLEREGDMWKCPIGGAVVGHTPVAFAYEKYKEI